MEKSIVNANGDYTAEQLGEIKIEPINTRTKSRFSLVVIQPGSNEQVTVIEPCEWNVGYQRVQKMVRAGVDPLDIRCIFREAECLDTDGLRLLPCKHALWWTYKEQEEFDMERGLLNPAESGI